jgi:hypothetical protein
MNHWDHRTIACILLSALCAIQGLSTLVIDLNRTHASNPLWPAHARFHVVWQSTSFILLAATEMGLVWWHGPYSQQRFYLASFLTSVPSFGFLIAFASSRLYFRLLV